MKSQTTALPSNPTADRTSAQPDTVSKMKNSAEPSYQNIENNEAYLSDEYEPVQEFMIGSKETDKLLKKAPRGDVGGHVSSNSGPRKLPGSSESPDRTLTLDNQYVKVTSPARKGCSSTDVASPDHDYQNMVPGLHGVRMGEDTTPTTPSPVLSRAPVPGNGHKSPTAPRKMDSPKPRVKPKPDLSALSPKKRSTSSSAILQNSTGKKHGSPQLVIVSDNKKGTPERPHLEELVFPTRVANGNGQVVKGNGEGNTTKSDKRWRSATSPVSCSHSGEEDQETEVLYVNVPDVGGEDLYENVTYLT